MGAAGINCPWLQTAHANYALSATRDRQSLAGTLPPAALDGLVRKADLFHILTQSLSVLTSTFSGKPVSNQNCGCHQRALEQLWTRNDRLCSPLNGG